MMPGSERIDPIYRGKQVNAIDFGLSLIDNTRTPGREGVSDDIP
jgi:hypothetical protein